MNKPTSLLLVVLLVTAACQSPGAPPTATSGASPTTSEVARYPLTLTDDEGTSVTLDARPERVISLTPATTELLFALGEGDRLFGRTDFDDYPPEATDLPAVATFSGVLIEQVVALEPDLVIAGGNSFTPTGDVERMRDLDIPVMVIYASDVDGVLADIRLVGQAVGADAASESVIAEIERRIDEVEAAVADLERPRVFYEIGYQPEIYAPAPDSFVADMVTVAGGDVITTGDPALFSISLEQLISQDPEIIVLGDAAYQPPICPDTVAAREGWDGMTAVANGDIRPVDDIIVTRPGPRIGEGLAALAVAIHPDAEITPPVEARELCAAESLTR